MQVFDNDGLDLTPTPQWLIDSLVEKKQQDIKPPFKAPDMIPEGQRNDTLYRQACSLRDKGLSQSEILATIKTMNKDRCTPPLFEDEIYKLVASACQHQPTKSITGGARKELRSAATEKGRPVDLDTLLTIPDTTREIQPIEQVLPGVAAKGDVGILVGPQKGCKSWLALRISCELSTGGIVLDGFAEVEPHKVLYLMYDNVGENRTLGRIRKAGWAFNQNNLRFVFNENIRRVGATMDLDQPDSVFESLIYSWKPDMVIIDTLGSSHSKIEGKNEDMKPIMMKLTSIARDNNIAILVLHHTRKRRVAEYGIEMQQDDTVGGGIILRLASAITGVEKRLNENGETVHTVKSLGSWYREFPPFEFSLIDEADERGRIWLKMPINHTPGVDKTAYDSVFRTIRVNYWAGYPFTRQDLAKRTGLSTTSVSEVLKRLVSDGVLEARGSTRDRTFIYKNELNDRRAI
jgi:hypothetical protein